MQLPPGRPLLDWRCVKDTSPAALVDYMAKWKVVYTSFLWFCSASYAPVPVPTGAALVVGWPLPGHSCRVGLCDVHAVVLRLPFVHVSCPC